MSIQIRYIVIVLLALLFSEHSYSVGNNCNSLKNALFSDYFKAKFLDDSVQILIRDMVAMQCANTEQNLFRFSIENDLYRQYSLSKMAEGRMPSFVGYLYSFGDSLDISTLFTCLVSLNANGIWTNDSLLNFVTHLATSHTDAGVRSDALNSLVKSARFKDCQVLASRLRFEPDKSVLIRYYRTLVRFHSIGIDSVVSEYIPQISNNDHLFFANLKKYNRYDFLTVLYTLQKKLKKEDNPLKKTDAEKILATLEDVISYLEKMKDEKATIGLPLDWGTTNSVGKE